MMTVPAVQDWLATLGTTGYVAVDLGGLNLVEVDESGHETGAYFELGGVREEDEKGDEAEVGYLREREADLHLSILHRAAVEALKPGGGLGEMTKLWITTGMTVEMEPGLVRVLGDDGAEVGLREVDEASAEKVVLALRLVAVAYGIDPAFSTTELACPDGGRVDLMFDGEAANAMVCIQAPADSTYAEREVVALVGDEWDEDMGSCTATLNAVALALSQGAIAVQERIREQEVAQ
jgi:hypothetical protein